MQNSFYYDIDELSAQERNSSESSDFCQEILQDGKKYHLCGYANCGKIFRFKSEFMRHRVIHEPQRSFNCPYNNCKKTFKREDALKNHVRIHTGELPFVCEIMSCGQRFSTKAGLRYHVLKHKGDKMYSCNLPGCGKSFLTMAQLKQHETAVDYHKKVEQKANDGVQMNSELSVYDEPEVKYDFYQDEKINVMKKDVYLDEFFAPETTEVGNIQWEMKNQFEEPEEIDDGLQDKYESMVKVILKENNAMKHRLEMCQTLMDLMHENSDLKQKLTKAPQSNDSMIATGPDDQIFSFLNF